MKRIMTLDEAFEIERRMKNKGNDAYKDNETRWKASRFAMSIIRKIANTTNRNFFDIYAEIQNSNAFENFIFYHYDIMHTDSLENVIYDIQEYIGAK